MGYGQSFALGAPGVHPLQVARVSAILLPAGAWDVAPLELPIMASRFVGIHLTYTRGGAGGSMDIQAWFSPYSVAALVPAGAEEWIPATLYALGAVVSGADTTSLAQANFFRFQPLTANAEPLTFAPLQVEGLLERLRVRCREVGAVGTPGTAQVTATLRRGG